MRILLAGVTGAIGRPLIRCLKENAHTVFGLARSAQSARTLVETGAEPIAADALDAASVATAILRVRPQAVINELTSLPSHFTPAEMKAAAERELHAVEAADVADGPVLVACGLLDGVAQAAELERVAEHHAPGLGLEGVTLHRAPRTLGMGFP